MSEEIEKKIEDKNSLTEVNNKKLEVTENNGETVRDEETIQYMNIIKITIENLGLGVRCEFDNSENPTALLIYDKADKFVTSITKEKGLNANVSDFANKIAKLLDASYKELPEGVKKLLQGEKKQKDLKKEKLPELNGEAETLLDEEKLALQGKVEIEPNKEKSPQNEEEGTKKIEEDLKQSTGDEYEIIGRIRESGEGNSFILSKIHETQGIIGSIYKVRNKTTGEYTLAGKESGKDGKIKVVNYKRSSMNLMQNSEHIVGGDSITEKQHEHANDLMKIDEAISLEITEHELNAVVTNSEGKKDSFKIDTEPVSGKSTTKEVEEVKFNYKKVSEVRNLIDQLNGIDDAEKESRFKAIMNDGKSIDENIAELKQEIENQKQRNEEKQNNEEQDNNLYPEGPWDRADIHLKRD